MILTFSFRDKSREYTQYEPIALVEHQGHISEDGETQGHYICDLEDMETSAWFRTNDNRVSIPISITDVTTNPVVILYKKIKLD